MTVIPVGGSSPGHQPRVVKAARGSTITAKHWSTEAAKRMLMNNLDPGRLGRISLPMFQDGVRRHANLLGPAFHTQRTLRHANGLGFV